MFEWYCVEERGTFTMYYQKMKEERKRLQEAIRHCDELLQTLPEGTLYCVQDGNREKWYHKIDGKEKYIPKTNQLQAARLAYKRYLIAQKQDLKQELCAVEAFLEKYPQEYETQTLLDNHRYQPLLQVFLSPRNEALKRWAEGPYDQNPYKPEGKIHCIHPGLSVRSKAEAMIASRLQTHRIPFRYECILYIAGRSVYPDFTIRHPKTGELYYWEHLGLLEDPAYSRRAGEKITLYANGGIYINRNLLLTDETRQNPLSVSEIDKVISDYFLCA